MKPHVEIKILYAFGNATKTNLNQLFWSCSNNVARMKYGILKNVSYTSKTAEIFVRSALPVGTEVHCDTLSSY